MSIAWPGAQGLAHSFVNPWETKGPPRSVCTLPQAVRGSWPRPWRHSHLCAPAGWVLTCLISASPLAAQMPGPLLHAPCPWLSGQDQGSRSGQRGQRLVCTHTHIYTHTHMHTHNTHTYPHTLHAMHVPSTHTRLAAGPWAQRHHRTKPRLRVRLLTGTPSVLLVPRFHRQANRLGGVSDLPMVTGSTDLAGRTQSPHSRTSLSCILGPDSVGLVYSGSAFSGIFFPQTLPEVYSPRG